MTNTKPITVHGKPAGGGALPIICTPLVGRNVEGVLGELDSVLPKAPDVIEWRVDFFEPISDTAVVVDTARRMKQRAGDIPILFTRRSDREGGERITLSEPDVVALYEAVCASRAVDLVDYELSNDAAAFARLRAASRQHDIALVGSYHNFASTPDAASLVAKFAQAQRQDADVGKVAVMPKRPADVLTLLQATQQASEELRIPLISMSMGALGSASRIVGGVFGSALTFAVGKASSAPGQIPIEELRSVLAVVRRAAGTP
jgi:3-dehydroquinate dehydratase-1